MSITNHCDFSYWRGVSATEKKYARTAKAPIELRSIGALRRKRIGGDLLSHTVTHAVPSAVESLTSVFGMGTGVTPLL